MRILNVTAAACVLSTLAAASFAGQEPQAASDRQQAGKLFSKGCIACHQAPDPRFATDRAWLTQVLDTA